VSKARDHRPTLAAIMLDSTVITGDSADEGCIEMGNLLGPDPELQDLNIDELRAMASSSGESVLRRGRAMMELGRRPSRSPALLREVAEMIRAPENRRLMAVGTTSISQLGPAGRRNRSAALPVYRVPFSWQNTK
jgi:hypothetical protein